MRRLSRFGVCSGLFCVDFYTKYQISFPLTTADFYLTKKAGVILMSRTCSCSTVCMGTISHLALFQKCCRSSHGFGEHLSWFILSFWCNSRKCLDSEEKLDASQNILESKWYPLCNHCSDPWAPITHLSLQKKNPEWLAGPENPIIHGILFVLEGCFITYLRMEMIFMAEEQLSSLWKIENVFLM